LPGILDAIGFAGFSIGRLHLFEKPIILKFMIATTQGALSLKSGSI
jgi:hypothetical protein